MAITRVALTGGTGNLGPAIVKGLLDAGFQLTVLSRFRSANVDPRAKIQEVDYNSLDSLVAALKGHDAVVNTLGVGPIPREIHLRLVEAAHKAGVLRYVPSEFGSDTANPLAAHLPVFGDKVAVMERLQELAKQDSSFSWSALINGPFLDWGLDHSFILNVKGPSTPIYDGGDIRFSTTTLAGVGRALAGLLKHTDETKNRFVYVAEADVTQNELLRLSGKESQIELTPVQTEDLEKEAYVAIKQSPPDIPTFATNLLKRAIFGGKYGSLFPEPENQLLEVPRLSELQIKEIVERYA